MSWKFKQGSIIGSNAPKSCTIDVIAERLSKELNIDYSKAHLISQEILIKVFKERKYRLKDILSSLNISDNVLIKLFSISSEVDSEIREFIIKNKINLQDEKSLKVLKDLL
ncbi:MAG: hypothetical protein QXV69_04450 [Sulfolobaceae archaeon]